jgi:multiple sugar transport system permease protein
MVASARTLRSSLGPLRRREAAAGLLFVLPWLVSLLVFTTYPVLMAFYLSFTEYNIIQPPRWIGTENYETMFTADPSFWVGVANSGIYALMAVPLGLVVSLLLAILLNMDAKGISVYRTLFYLPSLAPPVAATLVFLLLFSPDQGLVNHLLTVAGLPTSRWFLDPAWSKPTLVLLSLWGIGSATLIFLAGLKEIPQSLLEAAAIDGAGPLQRFRHVTLPLLSPVILFNLVMGIIASFQVFTQAFIIGGTTGDPLESTLFYMVLIYRHAFRYFAMGYASALAVVLFGAVLLVTLVIFRSSGRWVYYEGRTRG